ncbi:YhcN/YlaJ family sporulation lipoprotein [Caldicoprobacter faecalis]|uniref:Sporulation lipoprotein, YhcN/YlaJ family n=1 Tax=Caldicoprobacter faecalis TaxID=937334 RepID=A0A1I5TH01_9FIRM|nr:YhcN/YlaJ family sporulation lipoprotein [Caldicoprobacter faecalis]SFP81947.1 sporulation lipoprotein, YhcN/YlaJ family [Caldicoprobacter faecalis]
MKLRRSLVLFVCMLLVLIFVVACTQRPVPRQRTENVPRATRWTAPRTPTTPPAPNVTPTRVDNRQYVDRARRIADNVADLKEIQSATCVISGNTAIIGVQFSEQYKGKMTDEIKKKIDQVVKRTDTRINRVAVTADPDMVSRIQDIFRDIGRGRPLSAFVKEINELLNRIQPK